MLPPYRSLLLFFFGYCYLTGSLQAQDQTERARLQIRQATDKITVDGELSEKAWQNTDVADNFWMSFPVDDRAADPEIQTEVRVTYNDQFLFLGIICHGDDNYIIQTLKRDVDFWDGDAFAVVIDPVNERTNGFVFGVNPAGVQTEVLITGQTGRRGNTNSGAFNSAWDNKWFSEVKNYPDKWTIEIAIPFKTLRFKADRTEWGINFVRGDAKTNSWHSWAPVPLQFVTVDLGYTGVMQWDKPPKKVKSNFSVIPYTLGSYSKDFEEEGSTGEMDFKVGMDAKAAITSSLNLDLTVNPDFSQVDVDEQVTNLTRFNIRFPERRLFFLENNDLFEDFGIPPMRPFFSRRIGLDEDGNPIPIAYGARLSGNLNKDLRVGVMNLQTRKTDEFLSQNYTSVALHQQVMKRSVVKGYFHNRQAMASETQDYNRIAGLEFNYRSLDGSWRGFGGGGMSFSPELKGDNYFYNVGGGYDNRNISIYTNVAGIGDNYIADMGFMPSQFHYDAVADTTYRLGFQHWFTRVSYNIFPENSPKVISHTFGFRDIFDMTNDGRLMSNRFEPSYNLRFTNTSQLEVNYSYNNINLLYPFGFTDDEPLPAGRYDFGFAGVNYMTDIRKRFIFEGGIEYGGFYNGTRVQYNLGVRFRAQPWGNFGVNFVYNDLDFPTPYGSKELFLLSPRIEINFSRQIFWTTFLQYNTQDDNFNINSRLQWRFQPMSDLFIVYSENYAVEFWGSKNRTLVLKVNYWLNI